MLDFDTLFLEYIEESKGKVMPISLSDGLLLVKYTTWLKEKAAELSAASDRASQHMLKPGDGCPRCSSYMIGMYDDEGNVLGVTCYQCDFIQRCPGPPCADLDIAELWMHDHGGHSYQESPDPLDG